MALPMAEQARHQANPRTLTENQRARRHRILEAARSLVAAHGYHGMVMRDVAVQANVSPTTLYNLYNTKDDLLLAALRERVSEGWEQAAEQVPELGLQRLLTQMQMSAQQTRESPEYAMAIARSLFRANPGDQIMQDLVTRSQRALLLSLQAMVERGELHAACDLDRLANMMVAAFWSNYFMWANGLLPIEDLEETLYRGYLALLQPASQADTQARIQHLLHALYGVSEP